MEKFIRNVNPKVAMDIGGINFDRQFNVLYEKWYEEMYTTLDKRIISAIMIKRTFDNGKWKTKNSSLQTIKIKEILTLTLISVMPYNWKLKFIGEDNAEYTLKLDQNIIIE
mgnify:CR=1 FL=1